MAQFTEINKKSEQLMAQFTEIDKKEGEQLMTPDNDCNSIPPVSMLEAGLRDRIRKRDVGLNPTELSLP